MELRGRRNILAGMMAMAAGAIAANQEALAQQIVQTNDGPIVTSGGDITISQEATQSAQGSYNEGSYNVSEQSSCCETGCNGIPPWVVFVTSEGGLAYYDDSCNVCAVHLQCNKACR